MKKHRRPRPIRPETWRGYIHAEWHRLLALGEVKTWDKVIDHSEFPATFCPEEFDDEMYDQMVGEAWELSNFAKAQAQEVR